MPDIVTHSAVRARRFWWAPLVALVAILGVIAAADLYGGTTPSSAGDDDLFSNVNCDDAVDTVDSLFTLRNVAALPVNQQEPCPDINTTVLLNGILYQFGDTDCDGDVDSVDALIILRWIAGLLGTPNPRADVGAAGPSTCPLPGDPVTIEEKTEPTETEPPPSPTDTPAPTMADIKIVAMDFEILPFRAGGSGVGSQFFRDDPVPASMTVDFHNNGPDVADFFLELFFDSGSDFEFDFIPESGDVCLDDEGDPIDCDDELVEGLLILMEDVPVSTQFFIVREFDVYCRELGTYDWDIEARVRPIGKDPVESNNEDSFTVQSPPYPTCVE